MYYEALNIRVHDDNQALEVISKLISIGYDGNKQIWKHNIQGSDIGIEGITFITTRPKAGSDENLNEPWCVFYSKSSSVKILNEDGYGIESTNIEYEDFINPKPKKRKKLTF